MTGLDPLGQVAGTPWPLAPGGVLPDGARETVLTLRSGWAARSVGQDPVLAGRRIRIPIIASAVLLSRRSGGKWRRRRSGLPGRRREGGERVGVSEVDVAEHGQASEAILAGDDLLQQGAGHAAGLLEAAVAQALHPDGVG